MQDRPVILVDYRGVGRSGEMPESIPAAMVPDYGRYNGCSEDDFLRLPIGNVASDNS